MAGCLHFTSNNMLCSNAHLRLDVADHGLELLAAEDAVLDQEALLEELLQLQGLGVGVVHTCAGPGSVGGRRILGRGRSIDRSRRPGSSDGGVEHPIHPTPTNHPSTHPPTSASDSGPSRHGGRVSHAGGPSSIALSLRSRSVAIWVLKSIVVPCRCCWGCVRGQVELLHVCVYMWCLCVSDLRCPLPAGQAVRTHNDNDDMDPPTPFDHWAAHHTDTTQGLLVLLACARVRRRRAQARARQRATSSSDRSFRLGG